MAGETRSTFVIHALPGIGADRRMFPTPWDELPAFVAHDWPKHHGERTLPEVALSVCRECGIQDGDCVVGASLGGMVACEIAKIRRLQWVGLVGSAIRSMEVNRALAAVHPLAKVMPWNLLIRLAGKVPWSKTRMFGSSEASFVRSMCLAVFRWEGLGETSVRCLRIHGRRDWVIRPPDHADLLLDGGHLISMTHAKACVDFLRQSHEDAT